MHNFLICILGFQDYKLNYRFCEAKLHNLGLVLKDATVSLQNLVAAATAAASSPVSVVNLPPFTIWHCCERG